MDISEISHVAKTLYKSVFKTRSILYRLLINYL